MQPTSGTRGFDRLQQARGRRAEADGEVGGCQLSAVLREGEEEENPKCMLRGVVAWGGEAMR